MADSGTNIHEYSVSEISGAVKRTIEDAFGHVRVRGEISGFRGVHASGHCYFSLKDDKARIEAVIWRSTLARIRFPPEEGLEVIATGRVTTFAGQSKYQIVVDRLEPAGVGALMALLEERRKKLAAEGLFAEERKQPLPFLPRTIGVVTSETGAVIRDILHRLDDRFPTSVVVWPVRVQGETSAVEVAAAIHGFNTLRGPRPDVIIVARGGGSLEDLWGFNEEAVVRAVAASTIPVIAAIGHETDVTLIDHVADRRAPTPTAAAEMAVPVRHELVTRVDGLGLRLFAAANKMVSDRRRDLTALARLLPRPDNLYSDSRRTLDDLVGRLHRGLIANAVHQRTGFERLAARLFAMRPDRLLERRGADVDNLAGRIDRALDAIVTARRGRLNAAAATMSPGRLRQKVDRAAASLAEAERRLAPAWSAALARRRERASAAGGLLEALSYRGILQRGFALVTDDNLTPVRSRTEAPRGRVLTVKFHDGDIKAVSGGHAHPVRKRRPPSSDSQDTLL